MGISMRSLCSECFTSNAKGILHNGKFVCYKCIIKLLEHKVINLLTRQKGK